MLKRRSASFCSDRSGSRAHRRHYWYGPYFPTRVSRAPFHSIFIHQARFFFLSSPFPMQRPRPAGRRGLSSIFLVSLEKMLPHFLNSVQSWIIIIVQMAPQSRLPIKTKGMTPQTPVLGGENREIRRIYNKCTWTCIRLATDFIQALRCMNIFSQCSTVYKPEESGLGEIKTRPATTPCVCWHMLFGQCQKENAKREINYVYYIRQSQLVLNIASCFRTCTTCERDGVVQKAFAKRPRLSSQ